MKRDIGFDDDDDVTAPWVRDVFDGLTTKYPTHLPRAMLALQDMLDPDLEPTQTCPIITDAEAIEGLNKIWNINEDGTPKPV